MTVSLTIANVPQDLLDRSRKQAEVNRRSIQDEALAILESALPPPGLSLRELNEYVKTLGLKTPGDSTEIIRKIRDCAAML